MPIFEYRCERCGTVFDALVRRDDEEIECPACGGTKLEKLISGFSSSSPSSGGCLPSGGG